LRVRAGLRQTDLAERIGRPQQYVSSYETGDHRLDLFELGEVCRVLGRSLEQVVREYERRRAE